VGRAVAIRQPVFVVGVLAALTGASLMMRTGTLDIGYWIDEGISVGIASHDLRDIPAVLAQDGNPPLYYLLLHGWMTVAGTSEAATRALSLLFALLAIPASFWAGTAVFGDRKVGLLAAAGAAGSPYLTAYAQETRMYSLVVLLSILASASFVLAFVRGRRQHVVYLGVWLTLLLYTHTWGMFLTAGMAGAWVLMWRRGLVAGGDGAKLGAALAIAFAPWLPSLLFQTAHTGAPWSERPSPLLLLGVPGGLFGHFAVPLILLALFFALRRRPPVDRAVRVLAGIALATALLAWLCSQFEPAWTLRYHAVLFGPLLLALAPVLARGPRLTAIALLGVAALWIVNSPPTFKSNVRTVSTGAAPVIRPGDVVVTTQPEQVPALYRYLPGGVVYLTPMGLVSDPRQTDWRDGLARMRAGQAEEQLLPALERMDHGRRILLVTPTPGPYVSQAPWQRVVRVRTREWGRALRSSPRVRALGEVTTLGPKRKNAVRAELFEIR
jgi:mannosyltransferase